MPIPRPDPDIDPRFPGGGGRPLPTGPVDPTLPDRARLPAPGQEDKLQLLQVGIGRPAVLAYGRHLVGGTVILQHEIGSTGKTFAAIALGEGEWDGIEALFINGLVVDHTDTSKYHFHPGLEGELGTESDPAVRNQKICSLWPSGLTPQTTFSRTAYLSVLAAPDFEAPSAGLQVIGIYRGLRVRLFDNTGTQTDYIYSTNPAWIALDLILRHAIIPRETLNKALTSAQKDRFDWQAFSDWAADCDVATPQSTKRCESHIALVESTDLLRALEQQLLLGRGFLAERNGKIAPFMDKARSSVVTLGRADLWESQTSFSRKSTRDLPNKVTVRYRALASGTGTGTIDTVGTAVTGNGGSEFTKNFRPNEPCDLRSGAQQGELRIVDSVASDISMTLKTAFSVNQTGTEYGNPAQDFHAALRQAEDEAHQDAVGLVRDAEFDLGNAGPELAERRGNFLLARTLDLVERGSFSLAWSKGRGLDLFFDDVLTAPQDLNLSSTREWEMLGLRIEPDGSVVLNCQEYDPSIFSDAAQEEPTFSIPVSPRAPTGKFGSLIMGAKFVPDQEQGNPNVGEIEFVPLFGDSHTFWRLPSAAEFLIAKNAAATSQFGQESYTGRVYIIFSEQLCNSERSLAAGLDSHIIILRWNRSTSSFQYDNNTSWAAFTVQDTDICLFEVDRSGSGWAGKPTRWVGTQLLAHVRASEAITDAVEINQETPVEGRTGERILDILQKLRADGLLGDADAIFADGATFARLNKSNLNGNDIDLAKAAILGRTLANIADTGARFAAVEAGANKTETRTAAAIAGQGALATKNAVDLATAEVLNKTLGNIADTAAWKKIAAAYADASGRPTKLRRAAADLLAADIIKIAEESRINALSLQNAPAEAGANKTETRTAAAIAGQGALATKNAVDLATGEVTNKTAANIAETGVRKWLPDLARIFTSSGKKTNVEGLENAGNFKAGKFVGGNPGVVETVEEINGVSINPGASGWKNIGTKGIDIAPEINSVTFDLTVAQEAQPVTGKALKEATNNVGFAIASGSPSVPDVSRTDDGPLTLNNPTTGSGLTLTLYVRVQFDDTALTKVRGTLNADKATPVSAAKIT